jgi:hypothetical protein
MPKPPTNLPKVDAATDLYRAITHPDWWDSENKRVNMAAFDDSLVSAYITSQTTVETVLAKFGPGTGIVRFNAGMARAHEYDPVHEFDPEKGEDESHVHVYRACSSSKRKTRAQELADLCTVVQAPNVELLKQDLERRIVAKSADLAKTKTEE